MLDPRTPVMRYRIWRRWVRVFVTVGMAAAIASAAMRLYLAIDVST